ncbi:heterocyst differentiation related protein [Anabaena cylindrica FACHB-243]|uniref:Heterocyst differentiation-like protein PatN n=1 Tax=Anabaena cylindrica (strain ATCC 27899 / PCC 7122) TaxID=272123 RepID=K9ZLS9_ANACC|nr:MULTISPECIES: hypothetical protein [Anabaena]AFZ59512.1 heterocyst differentiation-like protein PatN [Anabaena cylindrica PCC 7122]MBD2418824.1 heterocyst differentiation related protein [Anabaena cylindrica FACHB-243]MBY5283330.1 heterocyst differentiation related protein [Anabaena sp. CCAP 1446/1C]MBY5306806.1 heterocyst differentiation related protein [Anabaena sp. CCAP 1446/1C]MCM2406389.1 heterocyst differentiation related protein [Anabaena sp. CCAP 1446/1C]
MSESMAFIGGVAVAGLAALLLLKGTNTPIQQSNFAATPQMPSFVQPQLMQQPVQYPPNYGQPAYPYQQPVAPNSDQRVEMEKLNMTLEKLKTDNEQLRLQNLQLQGQVQNFTQQQWQLAQQQNQQKISSVLPYEQKAWWESPIIWAVGGATLTIGGGVVVAGVLSLFSPKQHRPTRTVQVIHPYNGPTPPLANVRRAEFLPSTRMETRRMETAEYDELH